MAPPDGDPRPILLIFTLFHWQNLGENICNLKVKTIPSVKVHQFSRKEGLSNPHAHQEPINEDHLGQGTCTKTSASYTKAMASSPSNIALVLLLSSLAFFSTPSEAESFPPIAKGLSWSFYEYSCPALEAIVRNHLKEAFEKDIGLAAGLLRVHFHDCFVRGCDASVLLDGSASGPGEQQAPPNLTLRPAAFKAINELRALIDEQCGQVVSCADVVALAARDSVHLSGGPHYPVPLGRRDGLSFATRDATLAGLPSPNFSVPVLLSVFGKLNLDATDLVALSGGHTIGMGHCTSFDSRLFPTQDPTMDKTFANSLRHTCPVKDTDNTTVLDIRTPNTFDNKYYIDLVNREGLFTSDQDLYTNSTTRPIVKSFAECPASFFEKFSMSMIKMGQLSVLTGKQGEIRANCSAVIPRSESGLLEPLVDGEGETDEL